MPLKKPIFDSVLSIYNDLQNNILNQGFLCPSKREILPAFAKFAFKGDIMSHKFR